MHFLLQEDSPHKRSWPDFTNLQTLQSPSTNGRRHDFRLHNGVESCKDPINVSGSDKLWGAPGARSFLGKQKCQDSPTRNWPLKYRHEFGGLKEIRSHRYQARNSCRCKRAVRHYTSCSGMTLERWGRSGRNTGCSLTEKKRVLTQASASLAFGR